jgi:hypothetical protein
MKWNQIDLSYLVIRLLAALGLAWDLQQPTAKRHRHTEVQTALPTQMRGGVNATVGVVEPYT